MLGLTYLLLIEHPPKVCIARMLIEPSPTAGQHIVISWLHCQIIICLFEVLLEVLVC